MYSVDFEYILKFIAPRIRKEDSLQSNFRKPESVMETLMVTKDYYAIILFNKH